MTVKIGSIPDQKELDFVRDSGKFKLTEFKLANSFVLRN